jgi:TetR/AcrR family transcriptional repressor of nem operon
MDKRAARKARSHEKIVEAASRLLREKGARGVSVDALMAEAGLTRGGFYAHFKSKKALVSAALDHAFTHQIATLFRAGGKARGKKKLEHMMERYLTLAHVAEPGRGCPAPSLAGEAARGDKAMRAVFRKHIARLVEQTKDETGLGRDEALAVHLMWMGVIAMARAVGDDALAAEILGAARRHTIKRSA